MQNLVSIKYAKFIKNLLQMHKNMGAQTCQILQQNVWQGYFAKKWQVWRHTIS